MVIMPDYYRGTFKDPRTGGALEFLIEETQWSELQRDWEDKVCPYAKEHGAKSFGAIGNLNFKFCFVRYQLMCQGIVSETTHR